MSSLRWVKHFLFLSQIDSTTSDATLRSNSFFAEVFLRHWLLTALPGSKGGIFQEQLGLISSIPTLPFWLGCIWWLWSDPAQMAVTQPWQTRAQWSLIQYDDRIYILSRFSPTSPSLFVSAQWLMTNRQTHHFTVYPGMLANHLDWATAIPRAFSEHVKKSLRKLMWAYVHLGMYSSFSGTH